VTRKNGLLLLTGLLFVSACGTSRTDDVAYNPEGFSAPDPVTVETVASDYRLAPLDKVLVNVFQVEQLSGEYQVDLTGRINMPLIGSIEAVNQTTEELQARLEERLAIDYLKDPDVTVGIVAATGSNITIEGAVRRPGLYPNFGSMSLVQAVAIGGGLDPTANPKRVFVFRQIEGKRMIAGFDLTTIRRGEEPDPEVYRGDIIVVEGSKSKETWQRVFQGVQTFGIFRPF
jgi:polysaccharide export outer membrane protein